MTVNEAKGFQEQMAIASVDQDLGIVEQLRGLLTDQVLTVLAMVALGMIFGIACAGGARLFQYRLDPELPAREYKRRVTALSRIAFLAGMVWTSAILFLLIEASTAVRLLMAAGLGPIAGLGTPFMYDLLKWIVYVMLPQLGRWALDRIKAKFKANGGPPAS